MPPLKIIKIRAILKDIPTPFPLALINFLLFHSVLISPVNRITHFGFFGDAGIKSRGRNFKYIHPLCLTNFSPSQSSPHATSDQYSNTSFAFVILEISEFRYIDTSFSRRAPGEAISSMIFSRTLFLRQSACYNRVFHQRCTEMSIFVRL